MENATISRASGFSYFDASQEWRKQLRQPRAFCWRGVNYLEKMSHDTTFLCSPVGRSLLASVGLGVEDMVSVSISSEGGRSQMFC